MSKPLGLSMQIDTNGMPRMNVSPSDRVTDLIWEAVREAINANMLPSVFKRESALAWEHHLREDGKDALKELSR